MKVCVKLESFMDSCSLKMKIGLLYIFGFVLEGCIMWFIIDKYIVCDYIYCGVIS